MRKVLFLMLCARVVVSLTPEIIELLTPVKQFGEGCGYTNCPSPTAGPGGINVHIVPYTHFEMGDIRNFYEHLTGLQPNRTKKIDISVNRAFDYIITEMTRYEDIRFAISDMAYFFEWWNTRSEAIRHMVYMLLRAGRLSFVGGNWAQSDEAATGYHAIIESFTYTLRKINSTFMECGRPLVAWQADVKGHSREFASLVAQMGFDGLFVHAISYDDELARMRRMALEMLWRGSDDIGARSDIFTHVLFDGYWAPPGFCFGGECDDPRMITIHHTKKAMERAEKFADMIYNRQSTSYNTSHVMVMMGQRNGYYDAPYWFRNIEMLMRYVNILPPKGRRPVVRMMYSSPHCYMQEVFKEGGGGPPLETKQDDFMPIAYNADTYFIGHFTSFPSMKLLMRDAMVFLQMSKQLHVLAQLANSDAASVYEKILEKFNAIIGAYQDHTVVSGASVRYVQESYNSKLFAAIHSSNDIIRTAFNYLRKAPSNLMYLRCSFNESLCFAPQGKTYFIQIYNPLAWKIRMPVRFPIQDQGTRFTVHDPQGNLIPSALIMIPDLVMTLRNPNPTDHELVFMAEIPPLGFRSFFIERTVTPRMKRSLNKTASNITKHNDEHEEIVNIIVSKSIGNVYRNKTARSVKVFNINDFSNLPYTSFNLDRYAHTTDRYDYDMSKEIPDVLTPLSRHMYENDNKNDSFQEISPPEGIALSIIPLQFENKSSDEQIYNTSTENHTEDFSQTTTAEPEDALPKNQEYSDVDTFVTTPVETKSDITTEKPRSIYESDIFQNTSAHIEKIIDFIHANEMRSNLSTVTPTHNTIQEITKTFHKTYDLDDFVYFDTRNKHTNDKIISIDQQHEKTKQKWKPLDFNFLISKRLHKTTKKVNNTEELSSTYSAIGIDYTPTPQTHKPTRTPQLALGKANKPATKPLLSLVEVKKPATKPLLSLVKVKKPATKPLLALDDVKKPSDLTFSIDLGVEKVTKKANDTIENGAYADIVTDYAYTPKTPRPATKSPLSLGNDKNLMDFTSLIHNVTKQPNDAKGIVYIDIIKDYKPTPITPKPATKSILGLINTEVPITFNYLNDLSVEKKSKKANGTADSDAHAIFSMNTTPKPTTDTPTTEKSISLAHLKTINTIINSDDDYQPGKHTTHDVTEESVANQTSPVRWKGVNGKVATDGKMMVLKDDTTLQEEDFPDDANLDANEVENHLKFIYFTDYPDVEETTTEAELTTNTTETTSTTTSVPTTTPVPTTITTTTTKPTTKARVTAPRFKKTKSTSRPPSRRMGKPILENKKTKPELYIENEYIHIDIDPDTHKVSRVTLSNGVTSALDIQFYYYVSDDPEVLKTYKIKPGAFVVRPLDPKPTPVLDFMSIKIVKSIVVEEAHFVYSNWTSLIIRLYSESPVIEVDWVLAEIPLDQADPVGKEVFIRYQTDLKNDGVFYTDSNGRQTMKRVRDSRPMFKQLAKNPILGNFYPVNSKIHIVDLEKNIRFAVFPDRAEGGASLADGEIDLMLARRILTDDFYPSGYLFADQIGWTRGKHRLYLTKADYYPNRIFEKKLVKELELTPQPYLGYRNYYASIKQWMNFTNELSLLQTKLPVGVHILTIEPWDDQDSILLRLENFLEKSDTKKGGVKTVFIQQLFTSIFINRVEETTLAGNIWLKDHKPWTWRKKEKFVKNFNDFYASGLDVEYQEDEGIEYEPVDLNKGITLKPQQIRTFVCWIDMIDLEAEFAATESISTTTSSTT